MMQYLGRDVVVAQNVVEGCKHARNVVVHIYNAQPVPFFGDVNLGEVDALNWAAGI
jgi:hypothetical protein